MELFANAAAIAIMNSRLHNAAAAKECEAAVALERERAVRDVHEAIGHSLGSLLLHLNRADKATPAARRPPSTSTPPGSSPTKPSSKPAAQSSG